METILQLANSKAKRKRKLIVAGCLAQRYSKQLKRELGDGIHAIIGTGDFHQIIEACKSVQAGKNSFHRVSNLPNYLYQHNTPRLRTTASHFAYVKIADGCNNCCSYCVIPQVRGNYRSRTMESVVAEVSSLAQAGVKEVNLIAQDTTYFGRESGNDEQLTSLLKQLIQIPDIRWIRILYGHPAHIGKEFLELMATEEKICSYIDVPIQHIHDDILSKMGRQTTQSQIYDLIEEIRNTINDVTLRTSLIVGFPGETDQHFDALMSFVEQTQFDHLGVFTYSPEEDTGAAEMPQQVPDSVKEERLDLIAQLHQQIAVKKRQEMLNKRKTVLVENGGDQAWGRTEGQAPEIDDVVYIADRDTSPGEFLEVEIVDICEPYDLIGRKV